MHNPTSGAGAYGVVCAAQDSTENNVVAIKKCKKIFQSRTLAKRTLRELRLLRLFEHENVVKIKSVLKPLDSESFSEIYVVFEIMETDLAQIIRSPQTLKDQHVQYFTYQLLLALKYLHAANIVHRDLKYVEGQVILACNYDRMVLTSTLLTVLGPGICW